MSNLFSLPVHQLAEKIKKSELSSIELCKNYIEQIDIDAFTTRVRGAQWLGKPELLMTGATTFIRINEKLKFINNEHSILKKQLEENIKSDEKLNNLYKSLKVINSKLWVIEDEKRQCEKDKNFTDQFIKLSRDVHFLNDERAKIKLKINNYTGSKVKEIKEYTKY